jgi:hypothetical protein
MEYFKNVMLKLFETGQEESLLPVVATALQFSPAELERCRAGVAARAGGDGAALNSVIGYAASWLGGGGQAQQEGR